MEITRENFQEIYDTLATLYEKYEIRANEEIKIKTYLQIELEEYPKGGKVLFYDCMLSHTLVIEKHPKEKIKINYQLKGIPIDKKLL